MVLDDGCEERYQYWGMDGRLYVLLYLDTPRNILSKSHYSLSGTLVEGKSSKDEVD